MQRQLTQFTRRVRHQAPFAAVLAVLAVAFVYLLVEPEHWRRGSILIGMAMMLAAALRYALPQGRAGMLVVRGKWRDIFAYLLLGALIIVAVLRLG